MSENRLLMGVVYSRRTQMELKKVMPWGKDQGEYVVIEAQDFDESIHKEYKEPTKKADKTAVKPQDSE